MVSGNSCQKCCKKDLNQNTTVVNTMSTQLECSTCDSCSLHAEAAIHPESCLSANPMSSDILIVKHTSRKHLKSPTHFCKMCGYGDFSSTRIRRHLMLKHLHLSTSKPSVVQLPPVIEKGSILAERLTSGRSSDSEPESPLNTKMVEDVPEDLSMHSLSDHSQHSDTDDTIQVVPQFKPCVTITQILPMVLPQIALPQENKRSVIVRPPKKATAASRKSTSSASSRCSSPSSPLSTTSNYSILKRRLLGDQVVDEMEASEATLNANELNVKMIYQNSKFVIDSSEAFWLKGYNLPQRYELSQQ